MTEPQIANAMRLAITAAAGGNGKLVLLVFDDPKIAQYAATCRREDVILALREAADRLEKNLDVPRS